MRKYRMLSKKELKKRSEIDSHYANKMKSVLKKKIPVDYVHFHFYL